MHESYVSGGVIRKLWPAETGKLREHMLRLNAESRRLRFGLLVDDAFIEDYVGRACGLHSVIYGFFMDGEMRAVAEMRRIGENWSIDAEAAFSVEPEFQGRGIGAGLFGRLILAARNRGISRLYMNCLSENHAMQALARKFKAELHFDHGDVVGQVRPPLPSYLSLWREAIDDSQGFVMMVLDLPLHLVTETQAKTSGSFPTDGPALAFGNEPLGS